MATDFLDGETRPLAANDTRWNSQLKMVQSISKVNKMELDSIPIITYDLILTVRERLELKEFVNIMSAFEEVTDRVQGENKVTSSMVIPSIVGLRSFLVLEKSFQLGQLSSVQFRMS